jgi:serine protease DegQ
MRRACLRLAAALGLALLAGAAPALAQYPAIDPARGVVTMAPLLERVTPAVVSVSVSSRVPAEENPLFRDPFFRRFFDLPERPAEREVLAAGSGVIVDARQGLVITNNHVVQNAQHVTVTLKDQRELEAEIVGSDPGTDIALLRVRADGLAQLAFGDSDRLEVGDLVLAIGNPFGLGQTVTSGIISALGRSGITNDRHEDFIQTDAAINPGNSGGALVNTKGELIGINTAIIAPGGGNVGIGFAVPSNTARAVTGQLLRHGEVLHGDVGVAVQDLTPDIARSLRLADRQGALVSRIEPGSGAEQAGLRPGDVIVALDGSPVRSATDLRNRLGLAEPGSTVELGYLRNGERRTARAKVGAATEGSGGLGAVPQLPGASVIDLPEDHPAYGQVDGVLVVKVAPDSVAARYGLRAGDVILAVNRQAVGSLAELRARLPRPGRPLSLSVLRGDTELLITVR